MRRASTLSKPPPSGGQFSRLRFRVKCETEYGQSVHISGSSFVVGKQDPTVSLELVTTPEEYPYWRTVKPIIAPRNEPHYYMYALFEGGRFKKWEHLGSPRSVLCDAPTKEVVDTFDAQGLEEGGRAALEEVPPMEDRDYAFSRSDASLMPTGLPPAKSRLYLVCFHLPIRLARQDGKWTAVWNESLIAKTEQSVADRMDTHWVGTVASPEHEEFSAEDQAEIVALLKAMKCTPLFVAPEVVRGSYYGYCKQILWPCFHNVDVLDLATSKEGKGPTLTWDQANAAEWWECFSTVNRMFATHMVELLGEADTMWVHDYHLMLLPKMVSDLEKAKLGRRRSSSIFFLHIPFPTSQIFRALAHAELLLEGMLSANIVGFHAFDHARHFLNAGKRFLGLSYQSIKGGLIGVEYDRRTVMVVMSHVGIEPAQLNRALKLPAVNQYKTELKAKHPNKLLLGGIDVCQKLSGVTLKLLAFERLLADYPVWRDKVILVQRCLRPENRLEDEEQTAAEIGDLIKRIRSTYGQVVEYSETGGSSLDMAERMGLYRSCDVLVNTAIREGLNLIPLEYIYARKEPEKPGVVLASEFSACSSLLNGAVRINPFDVQRVAAALDQALTMGTPEKTGRRARDMPYISSRPSAEWTYQVMCDMWAMFAEQSVTHMEESTLLDGDLTHEMSMTGFTPLNIPRVAKAYIQCRQRVLFFDYGGTLLRKEGLGKYLKRDMSSVTGRKMRPEVRKAIAALCADPKNLVFIISGLHDKGLLEALGDIPNLGLAANNGLAFSWPPEHPAQKRDWEVFDYGVDWEDVNSIGLPILNKFTAHTNGSSIKVRDTGLAWSYYATDPEWGQMQARQLQLELELSLAAYDVKVQHVRGQIEVVPKRLHKGIVAKTILRKQLEKLGHYPDFVLCVGDDISDEHMFTSIYSFLADVDTYPPDSAEAKISHEADDIRLYMCTVGKKPTHATFYVDESSEVEDLAVALAAASTYRFSI